MDTFEIIVIIFLMIVIYQIYIIKSVVFTKEKFFGQSDEYNSIDDRNTINKLTKVANEFVTNSKLSGSGILDIKSTLKPTDIKTDSIDCGTLTVRSRNILTELDAINSSIEAIKLYS
jgi:hypothetical protein